MGQWSWETHYPIKLKEQLGKLVGVRFIMDYLRRVKNFREGNIYDLLVTDIIEGNYLVLSESMPVHHLGFFFKGLQKEKFSWPFRTAPTTHH